MARATYAPAAGELSEAIALTLKEHVGPTNSKIVQQKLSKSHPDWKLPERRVNKFLKRHLNNHLTPAAADDDDTTTTEAKNARRPSRMFKKLFSRRSVETRATPEVAPPETAPPEAAPVSMSILGPKEPEKQKEDVLDTEPAAVEQSRVIEDVYFDDNSVAGKEKCECNACVVM